MFFRFVPNQLNKHLRKCFGTSIFDDLNPTLISSINQQGRLHTRKNQAIKENQIQLNKTQSFVLKNDQPQQTQPQFLKIQLNQKPKQMKIIISSEIRELKNLREMTSYYEKKNQQFNLPNTVIFLRKFSQILRQQSQIEIDIFNLYLRIIDQLKSFIINKTHLQGDDKREDIVRALAQILSVISYEFVHPLPQIETSCFDSMSQLCELICIELDKEESISPGNLQNVLRALGNMLLKDNLRSMQKFITEEILSQSDLTSLLSFLHSLSQLFTLQIERDIIINIINQINQRISQASIINKDVYSYLKSLDMLYRIFQSDERLIIQQVLWKINQAHWNQKIQLEKENCQLFITQMNKYPLYDQIQNLEPSNNEQGVIIFREYLCEQLLEADRQTFQVKFSNCLKGTAAVGFCGLLPSQFKLTNLDQLKGQKGLYFMTNDGCNRILSLSKGLFIRIQKYRCLVNRCCKMSLSQQFQPNIIQSFDWDNYPTWLNSIIEVIYSVYQVSHQIKGIIQMQLRFD